ncbi:MAG: leucine--tRNA ligase [Thermoplasmataceae archaeon]
MDHETEKKWQEAWSSARIFEPAVDPNRKKFLITVPWPYTNGSLHVGHGRTYTLGDVVARYKRITGFNVLFPMGFHQSGTPILALASRLRNGDLKAINQVAKDIQSYETGERAKQILQSMSDPKKIADYFSNATVKDFTSMGYSIDWTRKFTSADNFYQDFVRWQFGKLNELGLITKGKYPILFSPAENNAVGEDDISDGDTDKVAIEEFTAVKFRSGKFTLLAASVRPETVFGITNLWINGTAKYMLFTLGEQELVASSEACRKLDLQHDGVKIVREVPKEEILSQVYINPINGEHLSVYEAGFVESTNGTGVVYSVPGHSIIDYAEVMNQGIAVTPRIIITVPDPEKSVISRAATVNLSDPVRLKEINVELYREEYYNGVMNSDLPIIGGEPVIAAREKIRGTLTKKGDALIFYETSRQAETRTGDQVLVAVLKDQWFIDYSPEWLKAKAHELTGKMTFIPDHYKSSMQETIDWLRQRPCARMRGLGTRLPMDERWVIESLSDSTIYPAVYTNSRYLRALKIDLGTIDREIMEYIFGNGAMPDQDKYSPEAMDSIVNARKEMDYWYGVDVRLTSYPHLTNHLAFYIMNHAALFTGKKLPSSLIISGIITADGRKMSKSKGIGESLLVVSKKYSADIYRLYVTVGADFSSTLDWNEGDVNALKKRYDNFIQILESYSRSEGRINSAEKWFVSSFYIHLRSYIENMEKYNIRSAFVSIFYEVINDLRRCESRGGRINVVLGEVLRDWLIALSPAIPHTAEEYWHRFIQDSFVSSEKLNMSFKDRIDSSVIEEDEYVQKLIDDTRSIMSITKINPETILITVAGNEIRKVTEIMIRGDYSILSKPQKAMISDFNRNRKGISVRGLDEKTTIESNIEYLQAILNARVIVKVSDEPVNGKVPWPGRPIITLSQ